MGLFGVVTVNTKTTSTAVWVGEYGLTIGGKPVHYLRRSRQEADRVSLLLHRATGLEVTVQSAIVLVCARKVTVRSGGPADVAVLPTSRALRRWLHKLSSALHPDQVEAIYEAAPQTRELANQVAGPPADSLTSVSASEVLRVSSASLRGMAHSGTSAVQIVLSEDERAELVRRAGLPGRWRADRARIILACAEGMSNAGAAQALGVAVKSVSKWRRQFAAAAAGRA